MKISFNWLKTYIDINLSPEKVAEILTDTGLEVEGLEKVETIKGGLQGVVIGEVLTVDKHPDADRLSVATVNIGKRDPLQIVCGAPNVAEGQKVVVATVGSTLYPNPEEEFIIKKSKIRGVESNGMICAEDELGLGKSHDGIMVLEEGVEIGTAAHDYFKVEEDHVIEIGLTPNRADAMGHIGVARDLKAYLNFHENSGLQLLDYSDIQLSEGNETINISVENPEACRRYAGAVIKGIKIEPSPDWLQNRLKIIGLNPINNIVDITNFVMHETGNPLHAFNLGKVGNDIVVRNANKGEKIMGLDEVERELNENDLMICNAKESMCIAGVYGGIDAGVNENTTDIFLESAYFNPVNVRKTVKRHQLNTDSSFRFERGVDPNNVITALKRAVSLIVDIAGGSSGKIMDHYPNPIEEIKVDFDFERCRSLCGIELDNAAIKNILSELDIMELSANGDRSTMSVPTYRVDVRREADLIEEVLRIYGFNMVNIPEKMNTPAAAHLDSPKEKLYNTVANLLTDNGFNEIMNNSLTSSALWDKIKSASYKTSEDVRILNPLSLELDVMRQSLLAGGLKSLEYNQNRQHSDNQFFEFGTVYRKTSSGYQENNRLGIWLSGRKEEESWNASNEDQSFYSLKGIVEALMVKMGIGKAVQIDTAMMDIFELGQAISISKKSIGEFGLLRSDISSNFGLKSSVFFADLDWDQIVALSELNKITSRSLPKTQYARRDFSLLLNEDVDFESIEKLAFEQDETLLREVGLFDVYQGKNLDKGKKSYAVSFIFQDDEQTLKDEQLDAIMENIRKKLESELGAELR